MRKITKSLAVFCIIPIWACTPNKNVENIKKVKIGMSEREVRKIMGPPDTSIVFPLDTNRFSYRYESTILHSDWFFVFFSNDDSIVVAIGDGL